MDSQPNNPSDNNNARPFSVGVALREAREKLGLSLADVANRLKFAPRQIEALEEDNFARLPEIAFVRGFVRSYAKLLHLDPVALLAALPRPAAQAELSAASMEKEVRFPSAYAMRKQNYIWLTAGLAVAVMLGLFVWLNSSLPLAKVEKSALPVVTTQSVPVEILAEQTTVPTPPDAIATAPARMPLVGPPLPPAIQAAQPVVKAVPPESSTTPRKAAPIRLTFDQDSWVEVTDKDGISLMAQLNLSGTERYIRGNPPFSLKIGNASGVHLYYQGKAIDLAPYNRAEVAHLTLE